MNVLSLFDGMSCGQIALNRAGINYDNYYASEIDRYAIKVTQHNYPNTIQLGDVCSLDASNLPKIDLLFAGSPCQSFSVAGDGSGFDGKSGLFFEFIRILRQLKELNHGLKFLFENVKMKKQWQDAISKEIGSTPTLINSKWFSAQHRERMYWTNINFDRAFMGAGEKLENILLPKKEVLEKLWLSQKERNYMDKEVSGGRTHWDFMHHSDTENEKSACVVANFHKGVPYNVLIDRRNNRCHAYECDFQDNNYGMCDSCVELDNHQYENFPHSTIRKFDPVECERLQTVPDNYTAHVSNSQRYKMIGNGWTVDVIAHILKNLK
jgi:DNA-cytosine methyltransferase